MPGMLTDANWNHKLKGSDCKEKIAKNKTIYNFCIVK